MIKVKDAIDIILNNVNPICGFDIVSLDNALDRIVFEDIRSKIGIPTFRRSAMDGYALVGDCYRYKIVKNERQLSDCTSIRINTGFPIPDKARAVAEIEIVLEENNFIRLKKQVEDKRNFTFEGIEIRKNQVLSKKGDRISVRLLSLFAYCGISYVKVFRKPIVGIITTGDEVIFPFEKPKKYTVFNSNYFILKGLVRKWFCEPVYFGHLRDNKELIKQTILNAIERCDVILTTGGVSMGTRDFIKDILKHLNAEIFFEKTTIKPGKPAVLAKINDKLFFGLPGWPSALYTTAYIYLRPLLCRLAGLNRLPKIYTAIIDEPMHSRRGKYYFDRVFVEFKDGSFHAKSAGSQKTDNFYSTSISEGLVGIDEDKDDAETGTALELILFDD